MDGHLRGYSISYKPIPFLPYWKKIDPHGKNELYSDLERVEHDICFLLRVNGYIKDESTCD